ncbi:tetratricopeptide repeat protein [Anabaena subtropica]|uniref:Tetratricopeptide repeat protein n=1 Tax=Anabaena subtropica FACHB-260 TaxID=2692884 RepID=A0ABR8CK75_9NOST|nr:tetratricopeptide repeat protein [Anabaena subtropica]MBD2342905.1 tetratricopeptide repeat protein [Anabaena subtropica FACHB-260]
MTTVSKILECAVKYHRDNRLTKAEQCYRQVLAHQPEHPEALYGLGVLAQQSNYPQEAEKLFNAVLQVQPKSAKAWFSLGNLHQAQGQLLAATAAYQQALSLQPNSASLHNNFGYTLYQNSKINEAIAHYQKALELQPNCLEADANLGNALHNQGKLSIEQQSDYATLNYQLGNARKQAKDWQNAIAYYQQAIVLNPELAEAHLDLGVILRNEFDQLDEALIHFYKALELQPDWCEVYLHIGRTYQMQRLIDKAVFAFRQAVYLSNPLYAKTIDQDSTPNQESQTPPQIQFDEIVIGGHIFPAISPVSASDSQRPFWSVVIPALNRPESFPECLASVLAQWTGPEDMEILVLDNGSNPSLCEIVNFLGKGIIRYYRFPETVPLQQNWNTVVALSRGQWIHLLHHDDYVLPGFYPRLQASLEICPESVGAAFTGYENINEKQQIIFSQQHGLGNYRGIVKDWVQKIGVSCPLSPPSVVIRRAVYEHLGGYKLDILFTCDWELYKRIASFYDWWYEPGILAHYREHSNSVTVALHVDGSSGAAHRQAIEISKSYLPAEYCAEITAKSRAYHFNWCLSTAIIPIKFGNLDGAWELVKEALKLDSSSEALKKLFIWLTANETAPLRHEIIAKFMTECIKNDET